MSFVRFGAGRIPLLLATAAALSCCLPFSVVHAQGKLEARYSVTLAGLPLGKGTWVIDIANDQYTAVASGGTAGLLSVFSGGRGSSAVQGAISRGNLVSATYATTVTSSKKTEKIQLKFNAGVVKETTIEPSSPPHPDRIPLSEAHQRGVVDPMSAALLRVAGNGDVLSPEACDRKLSVFDGRMRFDVQLAYKRMEQVKAEKGYQGPVVVCAAYFNPLAGYIPERTSIKYLAKQRDMEAWLAPISGTRVVVPYRIVIPTALGTGVLEATQFVSAPQQDKLVPTTARTY